jgi:hypothetical protein
MKLRQTKTLGALFAASLSALLALPACGANTGAPAPAPGLHSAQAQSTTAQAGVGPALLSGVPPATWPRYAIPKASLALVSDLARDRRPGRTQYLSYGEDTSVYLDGGKLTLATMAGSQLARKDERFASLCVAGDSKTLFVRREDTLFSMATKTSVPQSLGEVVAGLAPFSSSAREPWAAWIVKEPNGELVTWSCETGARQQVGAKDVKLLFGFASSQIQLLSGPKVCLLKTPDSASFQRISNCLVERVALGRVALSSNKKCLWQFDADGVQRSCTERALVRAEEPKVSYASARYLGPALLVGVTEQGGTLATINDKGKLLARELTGGLTSGLTQCRPLSATLPLFGCLQDEVAIVVRVAPEAAVVTELRLPHADTSEAALSWFSDAYMSQGGGVALPVDCEGHLGDVACVRDQTGHWKSVLFSAELKLALTRTAPGARLVPRNVST